MATLGIPQNTIAVLQKYNFNFQKKFGQNFLIDTHVLERIIQEAGITKDDFVLEIGPGIGTMTQYLCESAREVVAVEIDKNLIPILADTLQDYQNVTVLNEDILKVDINALAQEKNGGAPIKVVANLPYYITTPIITKFIEEQIDVEKIIVMVQNEVADRFSAKTGTKSYNSLTIFLNYYFDIKKAFVVSRNVFYPKPNVDSAVVTFTKKRNTLKADNEKLFFKLVRDAFCQKRKTLKNNLKAYDLDKIDEVLKKYNKNITFRAENITMDEFIDISNNLN